MQNKRYQIMEISCTRLKIHGTPYNLDDREFDELDKAVSAIENNPKKYGQRVIVDFRNERDNDHGVIVYFEKV